MGGWVGRGIRKELRLRIWFREVQMDSLLQWLPEFLFCEAGDTSIQDNGMEILQGLQEMKNKLAAVKPLVVCLAASSGEHFSGKRLLACAKDVLRSDALGADCSLSHLYKTAWLREVEAALQSRDFSTWGKLLDPDRQLSDETEVGFTILPQEDQITMQDNAVTKTIADLLRLENALDAVKACGAVASSIRILSKDQPASIHHELELLKVLLNPWDPQNDVQKIDDAASSIDKKTEFKLHKPLTLFPTGQALMATAANAVIARNRDATFTKEVQLLSTNAQDILQAVDKGSIAKLDGGKVKVTCNPKWHLTRVKLVAITTNASKTFQQDHKNILMEGRTACDKMADACMQVVANAYQSEMGALVEAYTKYFKASDAVEKAVDSATENIKKVVNKLRNGAMKIENPEGFLKDRVPAEKIQSCMKLHSGFFETAEVFCTLIDVLSNDAAGFDYESQNMISLYKMLTNPCEFLKNVANFSGFATVCSDHVYMRLTKSVTEHFPVALLRALVSLAVHAGDAASFAKELESPSLGTKFAKDLNLDKFAAMAAFCVENYGDWLLKAFIPNSPETFLDIAVAAALAKVSHDSININALTFNLEPCKAVDYFEEDGALDKIKEFQSSFAAALTNPVFAKVGDGKAMRESLSERFASILENAMTRLTSAVCESMKSLRASIAIDAKGPNADLHSFMQMCDKELNAETMSRMLKIAQSSKAKEVYTKWKARVDLADGVLSSLQESAYDNYGPIKQKIADLLRFVSIEFKDKDCLELTDEEKEMCLADKVTAIMTAVQSLARALKSGETRASVCNHSIRVLTDKPTNAATKLIARLPANLSVMLKGDK